MKNLTWYAQERQLGDIEYNKTVNMRGGEVQ